MQNICQNIIKVKGWGQIGRGNKNRLGTGKSKGKGASSTSTTRKHVQTNNPQKKWEASGENT